MCTPPFKKVTQEGVVGNIAMFSNQLGTVRNARTRIKTVPVQANEAFGDIGGIAPAHSRPRYVYVPLKLPNVEQYSSINCSILLISGQSSTILGHSVAGQYYRKEADHLNAL
jgi:hypothetical protein